MKYYSQRKNGIMDKAQSVPQNIRVHLIRLWSDGFQPYDVITLYALSLQLFIITIPHAEHYSTRFVSSFALGYKQKIAWEHLYLRCWCNTNKLKQSITDTRRNVEQSPQQCIVRLFTMTTQRVVLMHAHWKMVYTKWWGCCFHNKILSYKAWFMKRLRKVIPNITNAGIKSGTVEFVVTGGQIFPIRTAGFQNTKIFFCERWKRWKQKWSEFQCVQSPWWKACPWKQSSK